MQSNKHGVYEYKRRVPKDLLDKFPQFRSGVIKQSLHTKDPQEAKKLNKAKDAEIESMFESLRQGEQTTGNEQSHNIKTEVPNRIRVGRSLTDIIDLWELVKLIFLIMLNAKDEQSCIRAIRKTVLDSPDRFPPYTDFSKRLPTILSTIKDAHKPIAKYFHSGIGLFLQRRDSALAASIINNITKEERLPILCMHDGFLARAADERTVHQYMERAINNFFEDYK